MSFAARLALTTLLSSALLPVVAHAQGQMLMMQPAARVNPMVGTGRGPGDSENLFPGPVAPFGMVQLSPDTESHGLGYHYYQDQILNFSMTHMSGVGCANEGEVAVMPTTGSVQTDAAAFASPYSHAAEAAVPGYYQVLLSRFHINAELTATEHTGTLRFTFPAGQPANILLPVSQTLNDTQGATVEIVGDHEMRGSVTNYTFCSVKQPYTVYFDAVFSKPFTSSGTWSSSSRTTPAALSAGSVTATYTKATPWVGAYASWPAASAPSTVEMRIGISYVDAAGAARNLQAEAAGKPFEQMRTATRNAWNRELNVIHVEGGAPQSQTVFYTALYHSLLMPSVIDDVDGRYLGFDGKTHNVATGHHVYANWSGWDIYRTQIPLLAMIEPARMQDMAQSVVLMYQQGGWIGRWPQINRYTNVMAGSPLTIALATTWLDGLHGFDMQTAWRGMMQDATTAPPAHSPYVGEEGVDWINTLHYVPNDKISYGSVSQIQEDCIAYASLYYLAKDLGKSTDAKMLYQRALDYRNVFDPQDHFFRPRNADGSWVTPFDPAQEEHGFIEGSGWHYLWFAPADLSWLVQAMGRDEFNQRLDSFFSYKQPGWYGQYYNPYNETDLEAPFEYNWSGQPWKTQEAVRRVLRENYPDTPDGIPGNDDAGEMSAWAVMSMMGLYPVDPASRAYVLVSPVFPEIIVQLAAPYTGKVLRIETNASPEKNDYIHSVVLNGAPEQNNWVDFSRLAAGATLQFTLQPQPDTQWGTAMSQAPPSLSSMRP